MRPWTAATLFVFCSCAAAVPTALVEPAVTVPTASNPFTAPIPPTDPSTVEKPKAVVMLGRIQREPLAWILHDHSEAPLARSPIAYLAPFLAPALEAMAMADAPLEFVVAMRPLTTMAKGPRVAFSVPLGSFEQAWDALRTEARAGRIELHPHAAGALEVVAVEESTARCWLVASVGGSPARLVVGSADDDLEELVAFLGRGLPSLDLGNEPIAIEAWPRRFAEQYGGTLRGLSPLVGRLPSNASSSLLRALSPMVPALVGGAVDSMADLDRMRLTARSDGAAMVVSITAELTGQGSWGARTIASLQARPDTARELFARLPIDSELAWFSSGPDPARTDEARQVVSGWLRDIVGSTTRSSTLELVARTFLPRAPFVYAQGDASGQDATNTRSTGRGLWQRSLSTFGWHILGFDEPARQMESSLDAGMQAYNTGDLRALAYRELLSLCPGLGKISKTRAPRGLPAGSVLYEMKFPAAFFDECMRHHGAQPPEPGPDESLVVIMLPQGDRTWVGFGPQGSPHRMKVVRDSQGVARVQYGPQESRMTARMAGLLNPPAVGLAKAPDLEPLRAPAVKVGGFVTAAGLGGLVRFATMRESYKWERARIARRSGGGVTRIPFTLELSPGGSSLVMRIALAQDGAADLLETIGETFMPSSWAP